jgi:hypothetical protein
MRGDHAQPLRAAYCTPDMFRLKSEKSAPRHIGQINENDERANEVRIILGNSKEEGDYDSTFFSDLMGKGSSGCCGNDHIRIKFH